MDFVYEEQSVNHCHDTCTSLFRNQEHQQVVNQLEQVDPLLGTTRNRKDELLVRLFNDQHEARAANDQNPSRGLAQKLSIRLGKLFPRSRLVEINAHSLGSKFFSESGKLVSKIFDQFEELLEDEDILHCIFVDEIETLAGKRGRMLAGNEPFDGVRAVNAFLTGLDRLRHHPNVLVLCTSNLVTALVGHRMLDRMKKRWTHCSIIG